jgi:hypothetical protein
MGSNEAIPVMKHPKTSRQGKGKKQQFKETPN